MPAAALVKECMRSGFGRWRGQVCCYACTALRRWGNLTESRVGGVKVRLLMGNSSINEVPRFSSNTAHMIHQPKEF